MNKISKVSFLILVVFALSFSWLEARASYDVNIKDVLVIEKIFKKEGAPVQNVSSKEIISLAFNGGKQFIGNYNFFYLKENKNTEVELFFHKLSDLEKIFKNLR